MFIFLTRWISCIRNKLVLTKNNPSNEIQWKPTYRILERRVRLSQFVLNIAKKSFGKFLQGEAMSLCIFEGSRCARHCCSKYLIWWLQIIGDKSVLWFRLQSGYYSRVQIWCSGPVSYKPLFFGSSAVKPNDWKTWEVVAAEKHVLCPLYPVKK